MVIYYRQAIMIVMSSWVMGRGRKLSGCYRLTLRCKITLFIFRPSESWHILKLFLSKNTLKLWKIGFCSQMKHSFVSFLLGAVLGLIHHSLLRFDNVYKVFILPFVVSFGNYQIFIQFIYAWSVPFSAPSHVLIVAAQAEQFVIVRIWQSNIAIMWNHCEHNIFWLNVVWITIIDNERTKIAPTWPPATHKNVLSWQQIFAVNYPFFLYAFF